MKPKFILLLFCTVIFLTKAQTNEFNPLKRKISKVIVYYFPKEREPYIGITESNIRGNSSSKFVISDSICIAEIQIKIDRLKEVKTSQPMRSLYLLADIIYSDSSQKMISFEKAKWGMIKWGAKMYENSASLEAWIIACSIKN